MLAGESALSPFSYVESECRQLGFVSDLSAALEKTGELVEIEILVTYAVDEIKRAKVQLDTSMIDEMRARYVLEQKQCYQTLFDSIESNPLTGRQFTCHCGSRAKPSPDLPLLPGNCCHPDLDGVFALICGALQ
jgi:hypothetical protein